MKTALRNIFRFEEEEPYWQKALEKFPNKVPRFVNTNENDGQQAMNDCIDFTKSYCQIGSNPTYPNLTHSVTTLIDWEQIETILLPKITEYNRRWPVQSSYKNNTENLISSDYSTDSNTAPVYEYMKSRLDLSIHQEMTHISTVNTLKYMFFHMKCGILVMIRNNEVVIFCPFVNKDYTNTWGNKLQIGSNDGTLESYYNEKEGHYRVEHYISDVSKWWANGNIICNEYGKEENGNQWWGDHFLLQLKDMFADLCKSREVPNCDFFINKRDYPHLKFNSTIAGGIPVEPYGFIFDKDDRNPDEDIPLARHFYRTYAPIMSFYSSKRFADIPIPPSEDWEAATGAIFPPSFSYSMKDGQLEVKKPRDLFTSTNLKKFDCAWEEKKPIAFFRGTGTGGGVTIETNQRLHIAQVSHDWSLLPEYNGSVEGTYPFLDARISGWNLRDKKIAKSKMTFVKPAQFPFNGDKKTNFVEIYKQSTYKYLLYIEGHCAACRYGFMMQLGSVILKVESKCVADELWYFPLLKPDYDHILIKADLSDLKEKLIWCHENDDKCREIADNAKEVYRKYVSRDGILNYLQSTCIEVAKRWCPGPAWMQNAPKSAHLPISEPIKIANEAIKDSVAVYCCETSDGQFLCSYCQKVKTKIDQERLESAITATGGENDKSKSKRLLRDRTLRLASKSSSNVQEPTILQQAVKTDQVLRNLNSKEDGRKVKRIRTDD